MRMWSEMSSAQILEWSAMNISRHHPLLWTWHNPPSSNKRRNQIPVYYLKNCSRMILRFSSWNGRARTASSWRSSSLSPSPNPTWIWIVHKRTPPRNFTMTKLSTEPSHWTTPPPKTCRVRTPPHESRWSSWWHLAPSFIFFLSLTSWFFWIFIHYFVATEVRQDKKRAKRMRERKKRALSRKERHLLDNFTSDCRPKQFDDFLPLNKLWNGYIRDYLGPNASVQDAPARLVKADFHGAMISGMKTSLFFICNLIISDRFDVASQWCKRLVPASSDWTVSFFKKRWTHLRLLHLRIKKKVRPSPSRWAVMCDSYDLFPEMLRYTVIPKQKVHFAIKVGGNVFTIYGDHFCFRSGERSARKFKYKPFVAL